LLADAWFRGLADDGFLSNRGFQVPGVPGVVTTAHDERGEVGVVVVRAEAQRALAGLDADLDEKPGSCPDRIDRWAGRTSPDMI
jgi:hypothetical protein